MAKRGRSRRPLKEELRAAADKRGVKWEGIKQLTSGQEYRTRLQVAQLQTKWSTLNILEKIRMPVKLIQNTGLHKIGYKSLALIVLGKAL